MFVGCKCYYNNADNVTVDLLASKHRCSKMLKTCATSANDFGLRFRDSHRSLYFF